jgi:ribose 5-phosphate isomerase RpiB
MDDHANILELGGRVTRPEELAAILDAWINTEPSSDARHLRRLAEIDHPPSL